MQERIRIGALISGGGTNLQAIINACEAGKTGGEMVFVGADNPAAAGLERSSNHGIPTFVVDYGSIIRSFKKDPGSLPLPADFNLDDARKKQTLFAQAADSGQCDAFLITRAIAEEKLLVAMQRYSFDLLVLAGFMRNLTPYFIDRVNKDRDAPRIMNIHPALLPSFPGVDGYGDTYRYGCKVGGCTVHFIDYGEDSGPIIGQRCFSIEPGDSLSDIKRKGLTQEWILYPECIRMFARGMLKIKRAKDSSDTAKTMRRTLVEIVSNPA